jgi:hypothetical protein
LIEVTAVLVLLALLSTAAALSLRSACRGSQMDDVIGRITAFDQTARGLAVSKGAQGLIVVDPAEGRMRYQQPGEQKDLLHPLILPAGYGFTSVGVVGDEKQRDTAIACSTDGRTRRAPVIRLRFAVLS